MPPISSGGTALLADAEHARGLRPQGASGFGSAATVHLMAEAMRRAFADRARYLGDPEASTPSMPDRRASISKEYARRCAATITRGPGVASRRPRRFEWPAESDETTHLSVMDADRNAVSLTYTLEDGYGSKIVVPGAGFLLNNEMGDFNAGPGPHRPRRASIGTEPNLAAPGKRMLSSMTPTILARDGKVVPGHRAARAAAPSSTPCSQVILERRGLRHERAGGHRRPALPPPVAARPHRLRAVRAVPRHARAAAGARAHAEGDATSRASPRASSTTRRPASSRAARTGATATGPRSGVRGRPWIRTPARPTPRSGSSPRSARCSATCWRCWPAWTRRPTTRRRCGGRSASSTSCSCWSWSASSTRARARSSTRSSGDACSRRA